MAAERKPRYVECQCPGCGKVYFDWLRSMAHKTWKAGRALILCEECLAKTGTKKRREVSRKITGPGLFDEMPQPKRR